MQRRDDWDDWASRHDRWERESERQAAQAERRRELGPIEVEPARAALLAAIEEYYARCRREGRPPCSLAEATRGIGAEGLTAQEWLERTRT